MPVDRSSGRAVIGHESSRFNGRDEAECLDYLRIVSLGVEWLVFVNEDEWLSRVIVSDRWDLYSY